MTENNLLFLLVSLSSLSLLMVVWYLVTRMRLRPAYSILWLTSTIFFLGFALFPGISHYLATNFGVDYPPSVIFGLGIFFLIVLNLLETLVLSNMAYKNADMAELIAILQWRVEVLESNKSDDKQNIEGNKS